MTRPALAALAIALTAGLVSAQDSPFGLPAPLGGPIVGPDGRIRTGLDAHPVPSSWSSAIDFGLSGSQGNTDTLKVRLGVDVRYDSPEDTVVLNALYILSQANGGNVENKAFFLARNDLPLDAGLGWYAQGVVEYDEFRAIDLRLASHSGLSYTALQDGTQLLKLRAGIGMSRESGGPGTEWVREGQGGADYEYHLTARTTLTLAGDYYPDVRDFARYRLRGRVSLDILLDPDLNLVLRLGAFDRYDSRPFGSKRNDLDYFTTLQFRF